MISIIIRAYNEDHHIGRLLNGIALQQFDDDTKVEVILVDSGSTDSTVTIAKSMGARIVKIKKEDFSFGRALNIGCSHAKGDCLIFASAHVYPIYNDWLENMIKPFQDKSVGLVYGKQEGNKITRFSEDQVFRQWFPLKSNYNQESPFCNNANCAIRKNLWQEQRYDESLTGLEDLDWAEKMMKKGCKVVYEADAPVVHVHEETHVKIKRRYQREAIALKRIMPHVHFNRFDFISHVVSSGFNDCIAAIRQGVFFSELKSIIVFRLMQYWGTYLGHNQSGQISKELKTRFYYPVATKHKLETEEHESVREQRKIEYS
jgi:rhamnosyltransferase